MPGQERRIQRASQHALGTVRELGREIRVARLDHDLSQATAARGAGLARASWGRMERGEADGLRVIDLARALAVVGLDLHLRAYPVGSALRDEAHLRLLERLRSGLGNGATWATEVPLPQPGDRRAWDAVIRIPGARIGVEAETRARDSQALQRRLASKQRDGGVDHVVLLLADTRHNRTFLRSVGEGFRSMFPVDGRIALSRLSEASDPGGNAIVLL